MRRTFPTAVAIEGLFTPAEAARLRTSLDAAALAADARLHSSDRAAMPAPVVHLHSFRTSRRRYFLAQALTERRQVRWADDLDDLITQAEALLRA